MDKITFRKEQYIDYCSWHNKLCVYDNIIMDTPGRMGLHITSALTGIAGESLENHPLVRIDAERDRETVRVLKEQLVSNGGKWCDMHMTWPYHLKEAKGMGPVEWIRLVRKKGWTFTSSTALSANGSEGADLIGNINEYSAAFFYRILDKNTLEEVKRMAPEIKQSYEEN